MKSGKGFVYGVALLAFFASVIWVVTDAAGAEALQLQVAGLKANEVIPQKFVYNHSGCSGDNISPEITWSGVPASAKSLALVVLSLGDFERADRDERLSRRRRQCH